jgi:hypothetical protein
MQLTENQSSAPRALQGTTPRLQHSVASGELREEIQRYISGVFQISHGALVKEFMPLLASLRDDGNLTAALGLRGATTGPLFCEQYLDEPVEHHIQSVFGQQAARASVLEVGSLVASNPGHAALLYTLVGVAMIQAGVHYLLFTANRAVRLSLRRSGLASVPIAHADRSRLAGSATDWGSYYNGDPMVMLGDVRAAMEHCNANHQKDSFLRHYHAPVNALAGRIQSQLQ